MACFIDCLSTALVRVLDAELLYLDDTAFDVQGISSKSISNTFLTG